MGGVMRKETGGFELLPSDKDEAQDQSGNGGNSPKVQADGPPEPDNSAAQKNLERPSAEEIYQQVARNAKQELKGGAYRLP